MSIIVDSYSHSWEGEGGVLEMQEDEFERLGSRKQVDEALVLDQAPKGEHNRRMVGPPDPVHARI